MSSGNVVNPPLIADRNGVPVGFVGGRYGQDFGLVLSVAQQHIGISGPADTNDNTLFQCRIPGGLLGENDSVVIDYTASHTSSANAKTLTVRFGGTAVAAQAVPSTTSITMGNARGSNRGDKASQIWRPFAAGSFSLGLATTTLDTTQDQVLSITGQKASAGEFLRLDSVVVYLIRGA